MSRLRPLLAPLCLFLLALVVRFVGLNWGLPNAGRWYSYHPDESTRQIVGAVARVLGGDLNPGFFNYPSLCIYATTLVYYVLQIGGLTTNVSTQSPWPVIHDIILAGRIFSVLCGAGTAVCVWGMAREVGLRRGAVLSGILVALCPGLVEHSHFATVDVPATFFVAACLWTTLKAFNAPGKMKWWIWSGVLAGLGAGTKYNAGLVIIAPLLAFFLVRKGEARPAKWVGVGLIGLAALGFLVSTPYALLAPEQFLGHPHSGTQQGFLYELLIHPREGHGDIFQGTGIGWWYHLTFNLPFVLTWPLLIGGLIGIFWAVKDRRQWPLLFFVVIYFLALGTSNVRFMRYTFLMVPPLMVWASLAATRLPKSVVWAGVLGLFALWGTKDVLAPLVSTDQRDLAAAYMKSVGGTPTFVYKPWYYTPPVQPVGDNVSVPGTKGVELDGTKLNAQTDTLAVNDYEVREGLRLDPNGPQGQFLKRAEAIKKATGGGGDSENAGIFEFFDPTALPGRKFEPHDYFYTHPGERVYRLR